MSNFSEAVGRASLQLQVSGYLCAASTHFNGTKSLNNMGEKNDCSLLDVAFQAQNQNNANKRGKEPK